MSTTIRLKAFISKAFYCLLNRFGSLVLSLYSFVFHFFFSRRLDLFLFNNWFFYLLFSTSFSLKTAAIEVVKLISKALVYLLTRFGFSFLFSNLIVICLLVFYKFQLNSALNLLKVSILEAFYHLLNRFGLLYKYVLIGSSFWICIIWDYLGRSDRAYYVYYIYQFVIVKIIGWNWFFDFFFGGRGCPSSFGICFMWVEFLNYCSIHDMCS